MVQNICEVVTEYEKRLQGMPFVLGCIRTCDAAAIRWTKQEISHVPYLGISAFRYELATVVCYSVISVSSHHTSVMEIELSLMIFALAGILGP
jgi:hypothetical protein